MFGMSDEQAMWRVQMEDDAEAFAVLVERWQQPIRALCTRMVGDIHRGEDLAQEAFTRVYTRRKAYVASGKFSTFLWRVALNLCYDELRKRERRRETALDDPAASDGQVFFPELAEPTAAPDVRLEQQEAAEQVRAALMQVSEGSRAVLILRHYEGLRFREIAEVLGIPEGTVKSRMADGLTQMARLLTPGKRMRNEPGAAVATKRLHAL